MKSAAGKFFKRLAISLFWMVLLFLAAFGSYHLTYYYLEYRGGYDQASQELISSLTHTDEDIPEVFRNVIYGVDETTGQISQILLEIFDTKKSRLSYITIPEDMKLEISADLYRKFYAIHREIPQIVSMENLQEYFKGNEIYEYGNAIIGDVLGMDITCYTTLGQDEFFGFFTEDGQGKFTYKKNCWKKWEKFNSKEDIKNCIYEFYQVCSSDFGQNERSRYAEHYLELKRESISFERLKAYKGEQAH